MAPHLPMAREGAPRENDCQLSATHYCRWLPPCRRQVESHQRAQAPAAEPPPALAPTPERHRPRRASDAAAGLAAASKRAVAAGAPAADLAAAVAAPPANAWASLRSTLSQMQAINAKHTNLVAQRLKVPGAKVDRSTDLADDNDGTSHAAALAAAAAAAASVAANGHHTPRANGKAPSPSGAVAGSAGAQAKGGGAVAGAIGTSSEALPEPALPGLYGGELPGLAVPGDAFDGWAQVRAPAFAPSAAAMMLPLRGCF